MLDISPVLLLSSGIVFLLVLLRLNSCLYKPLFKHMDDRTKFIATDLENSKNNSDNIDDILSQAQDIISKAKIEASLIRENTIKEAQNVAGKKLQLAKDTLSSKYNDFVESLADEKGILKQSLVASMPSFQDSLKAKISSI